MTDTREDIILRLQDVLGSVTGITGCYRDRADLKDATLPAAVVLDGSEFLLNAEDVVRNKTGLMPPAVFILRPQVFVLFPLRDNLDNLTLDGASAPIGPEISSYRMQVMSAVINDPGLLNLVAPTGQIVYTGCDTDMQSGSTVGSIGAQLQMHFDFYYLLNPPRG